MSFIWLDKDFVVFHNTNKQNNNSIVIPIKLHSGNVYLRKENNYDMI